MGLLSLLPGRHADFDLQLDVLDLQNVPLVSGTFSVEWKFKSSKAHPEYLIKDKPNGLASRSHLNLHQHSSSNSAASTSRPRTVSSTSQKQTLKKAPTSTSFSTLATTISHSSDTSSSSSTTSSTASSSAKKQSRKTTARTARRQAASRKDEHGRAVSTSSKGQTEGVEIRDHACTWNQEVKSSVRISVGAGKEQGVLGERELSLIVHQHLSFHESEKSARLGQLVLNLAEYVGKGKVTRRYLLDEGKTNATIKLSIEMVQIGGQTAWNPLPISKGQAAGTGLENLVGNHTRPVGEVHASPTTPASSTTSLSSKQSRLSHPTPSQPSPVNSSTPASSQPPSIRTSSHQNLTSLLQPSAAFASATSFSSSKNTSTVSFQHPSSLLNLPTANSSSTTVHHNSSKRNHTPTPTAVPSTNPSFLNPTSTEAIIENLFNPYRYNTQGSFTVPIPPPSSAPPPGEREAENGSYNVVGRKEGVGATPGVGSSPLKQEMSSSSCSIPSFVNGGGGGGRKLATAVVPSAWKKKGGARGREPVSEEGEAVSVASSRAASRERG